MPEKITIVQVGGSVERALKGDYQIDVKAVLTEAWQLTTKSRLAINLGLLFALMLGTIVSFFVSDYFGGIEAVFENQQQSMLLNIMVTVVVWPFVAGIEMMGVSHAVGMKTSAKMTFSFLYRASWVVLCALLTSVIIEFGIQLFVLPGIFFAVTLSLTIPLVIEKQLMPMKAIMISIKAMRFKFIPLLLIYFILVMFLVMLLFPLALLLKSALAPIGIMIFLFGISYLAPLFYNTKGILYREIFGINLATDKTAEEIAKTSSASESSRKSGSDDTFSA